MLRWPHGGHGDCASARAVYGVRRWVAAGWGACRRAIYCVAAPPEALSLRSLSWCHGLCTERLDGSAKAVNASFAQESGHPCTVGEEACRATRPHPWGGLWAPFWAFCYVITDLRIYPPPSPSHAPTRSRASANQVTAGYRIVQFCRHRRGPTTGPRPAGRARAVRSKCRANARTHVTCAAARARTLAPLGPAPAARHGR